MSRQPECQKQYFEPFSKTSSLDIGSNLKGWTECKESFDEDKDYQYLYVSSKNSLFPKDFWSVGLTHKDVKDLHEYLGQIIQYMEDK